MTNDLAAMQARCDAATEVCVMKDGLLRPNPAREAFMDCAWQDVPNLIAEVRALRRVLQKFADGKIALCASGIDMVMNESRRALGGSDT